MRLECLDSLGRDYDFSLTMYLALLKHRLQGTDVAKIHRSTLQCFLSSETDQKFSN